METRVIKIGGSMVSSDASKLVDTDYLFRLKSMIMQDYSTNGNKYMLVIGGGAVMRKYRDVLEEAGITNTTNLHWVGTAVNVLNAMIVKAVFDEAADDDVLKFEEYYDNKPLLIENIVKIGGGGRPGHSGDMDAFIAAQRLGSSVIYSLKNVDGVYDSDPHNNSHAKRKNRLTWDEYLDIIGNPAEHEPGANYPIDPVTSRMSRDAGMKFIILSGLDLKNVEQALKGENFVGTIVQ